MGNIMKRIQSACICQTLHFMQKDDVDHDRAAKWNKEEIEKYKKSLERNRTQFKIIEELEQPDGSIVIKVLKQYNNSPVGNYLN